MPIRSKVILVRYTRGGGWIYIGKGGSHEAFFNEHGKQIHSRLVGKGGRKNVFGRVIKTYDSDKTKKRKLLQKYKYLMPLDDAMRKQIEPLRKPYPKKCVDSMAHHVPDDQSGEGGMTPTSTLHSTVTKGKDKNIYEL